MARRSILTVGSLNMDQVVQVARLPVMGETVLGAGSLLLVPGGKGANQAVAMARLGVSVSMAGRVGRDPFGERLLQALQAEQIDTSLVVVDEQEASGVAFIFLSPTGENAIVVASGANMRVGEDTAQMRQILATLPEASALVLQMEIPLEVVKTLVAAGHQAGVPVFLNLAPARALPLETLRRAGCAACQRDRSQFLARYAGRFAETGAGDLNRVRGFAIGEQPASSGDRQGCDYAGRAGSHAGGGGKYRTDTRARYTGCRYHRGGRLLCRGFCRGSDQGPAI